MLRVLEGTNLQHCLELAPNLRPEDLVEIQAARPGVPPLDILKECVAVSAKSYSVIEDGIGCIAIFGIRSWGTTGIPWMLSSDYLFENRTWEFVRRCRGYAEGLVDGYESCFNYVSQQNTVSQRWLSWLGFTVHKQTQETVNGVVFHPFTYTRITNV